MSLKNLQVDDFDGQGKIARDHGPVHLQAVIDELALRAASWRKDAADGAAATATAESAIHAVVDKSQILTKVRFVPDAALTADNTNYATIIVRRRNSVGAGATIVAQATTQITGTGNWVAFAPVTIPLSITDPLVDDGQSLTVEITKSGTGVVVPAGELKAFYK